MLNFDILYRNYSQLTDEFFANKGIEEIKKKSQYFTPLEEVDKIIENLIFQKKEKLRILDPASGNGILILKIVEKIFSYYEPKELIIDVLDTDINTLNIFKEIMREVSFNNTYLELNYLNQDFLTSEMPKKYDYIIMNPPYKKINVNEVPENLKNYLNGQPNLYHLFIGKALNMLDYNGVLSIISPKNYLSGRYTEKLRKYITEDFSITNIHTFNDRKNIFENKIVQEICIVHIANTSKDLVTISYNGHSKFETKLSNIMINNYTNIIQTPRNLEDLTLLEKFKKFPIGTIGKNILMKTGKVVQFRVNEKEKNLQGKEFNKFKNGIPLIVYRHINTNEIKYKSLKNKLQNNAITLIDDGTNTSFLIKNSNYLLIRKNTDKKYQKLIHSIAYLEDIKSEKIAIDNGIAYFTNFNDSLTREEVLGLQCIMMSKQFDDYYRMINSSHAINVYELENMHFPDLETIRIIGNQIVSKVMTVDECSDMFAGFLN